MADDTYQLVEVKGDNKINDVVVQAKKTAAEEMAAVGQMNYFMYAGSQVLNSNILEEEPMSQGAFLEK